MKLNLPNTRLTFPSLFEASDFDGDGNFKYRAGLLIPKGSDNDKKIWAAVKQVAKDAWGAKYESILESIKHIPNRAGYRDGDVKGAEEYAGCMYLNAANKARPLVIDRDKTPLVAADGRPYSGCYVSAVVTIYAYDNKGKGIGFSLGGIQFYRDGDAFAGGGVASGDDFDSIEEGTDAGEFV